MGGKYTCRPSNMVVNKANITIIGTQRVKRLACESRGIRPAREPIKNTNMCVTNIMLLAVDLVGSRLAYELIDMLMAEPSSIKAIPRWGIH